jgi:hypothetical protein
MPLSILHPLLNVYVNLANKRGLKKKKKVTEALNFVNNWHTILLMQITVYRQCQQNLLIVDIKGSEVGLG